MGPAFFSVNIGISRSFAFGNVPAAAAVAPNSTPAKGATSSQQASNTPAPAGSNAAKPAGGPTPEKRYSLTFSVNIQNLLNSTNLAQPIGNLSSPRFGESTSTAGSFGFGPGGSAAAGNRRIQLQLRFNF
jgi:hypothetical protein